MIKPEIGIIGAGPSGLAMSLFLNQASELLEQKNHVGGHAASYLKEGFTFDYGPHIMFSQNKSILNFMITSLNDNVEKLKRANKIAYKGLLVKYPFENDLKSLPKEDCFFCLKEFVYNPYKELYPNPKNMREWLLSVFGKGICESYLFPYNEKVWNIAVDKLSMHWAERIPKPPADDIIKSAIGFETEGYLHQLYYHYPKQGGYQAISESWAKACQVTHNFKVKKISKNDAGRFVVASDDMVREYATLISTMPIHQFFKCLQLPIPLEVRQAVEQLIVNPMFIISFGVRGEDLQQLTAVYLPDPDFHVNRVSYPSTFSKQNAPEGHYSVQAEITCVVDSDLWQLSDREILNYTKKGLQERGLLPQDADIVVEDVKRELNAYVVYDVGYEQRTKLIRDWCQKQGIYLVGRFSYFEYVNVDMAIERALNISMVLNDDKINKSDELLERALKKIFFVTN
ncbi:MAG: FAD-dependent oxidoreductase [bacterium]|nr:FAD-dependent oxidoreductase [bacterium]